MKSKFFMFFFVIFSMFFVSTVSAALTVHGEFLDGSTSAVINNGESVKLNVDFFTTYPSMNVRVRLYDLLGNTVHVFLDNSVGSYSYSNSFVIDSSIYGPSGKYEIEVYAKDGIGEVKTKYLAFEVKDVASLNNPPVVDSILDQNVNENSAYSYQVVASDVDGDALNYSLSGCSWLSVDSSGLVSGTSLSVDVDTDYNIQVSVSDGEDSVSESYVLTVLNVPVIVNNPPVVDSILDQNVNENSAYSYQVVASDVDGDTLSYSLSGCSWLSIDSSGLVSGTSPSVDVDTDYDIQVSVSDGEDSVIRDYDLTVLNVNNPTVVDSILDQNVNEDSAYSYQVVASDVDGDTLSYSLSGCSWLSIDSSGLISGTSPSVDVDTDYDIQVSVSDGEDSVIRDYVLTVVDTTVIENNVPVIEILNPVNGENYNDGSLEFKFNVTDEDLNSCWYEYNGVTAFFSCVSGESVSVLLDTVEGENIFTVYASDDLGNLANESVVFEIDLTSPVIDVISPRDSRKYEDDDLNVKVNVSEEVQFVELVLYRGKAVLLRENMTKQTENDFYEYKLKNLKDGSYKIKFNTVDLVGNSGEEIVTFRIDTDDDKKKKRRTFIEEPINGTEYHLIPELAPVNDEFAQGEDEDKESVCWLYYLLVFLLVCFIIFILCRIVKELRR